MNTRVVATTRWKDENYSALSCCGKVLSEYLLSNPTIGHLPIYKIRDAETMVDTGLTKEELDTARKEVETVGIIYSDGYWVIQNDYAKFGFAGPKNDIALQRAIEELPDSLKKALLAIPRISDKLAGRDIKAYAEGNPPPYTPKVLPVASSAPVSQPDTLLSVALADGDSAPNQKEKTPMSFAEKSQKAKAAKEERLFTGDATVLDRMTYEEKKAFEKDHFSIDWKTEEAKELAAAGWLPIYRSKKEKAIKEVEPTHHENPLKKPIPTKKEETLQAFKFGIESEVLKEWEAYKVTIDPLDSTEKEWEALRKWLALRKVKHTVKEAAPVATKPVTVTQQKQDDDFTLPF